MSLADAILTGLAALCTLAVVFDSARSRRYAREAKEAAGQAAAAADRAQAARQRSAELKAEQQRQGPTHLSFEQLLPVAVAMRLRKDATRAGTLLGRPLPDCPACGQAPTQFLVSSDHPDQFLYDQVAFGFRPCGHNFTADAEDLHRVMEQL
jgi:hypothetical protein